MNGSARFRHAAGVFLIPGGLVGQRKADRVFQLFVQVRNQAGGARQHGHALERIDGKAHAQQHGRDGARDIEPERLADDFRDDVFDQTGDLDIALAAAGLAKPTASTDGLLRWYGGLDRLRKLGVPVGMREGILFVTYPTLRSGRSDATRLEQILDWAGPDFDGVIVFDEAHAMANAAGGEGSRGKVKGSEQGVAGVRLQNLLPRARVLYASATGASDVNNLAYAVRLGLWGPGTAFATREQFISEIRDGGIAAMELVAVRRGGECTLQVVDHLVDDHTDGGYAVLAWRGRCPQRRDRRRCRPVDRLPRRR